MRDNYMITGTDISKVYDKTVLALDRVNFKVDRNKITGVIGRNGSGKTTLFKIIAGVITDHVGQCYVDGVPVSLDYSEKVSYLPEMRGLDDRLQVLEHLTDMVRYKGIKSKEARTSVENWLDYFKLSQARYKKISTLSKGNQQKLQFIVAIASNPDLLILDEPFSGLDPITSDIFWEVILRLRDKGCTIIFSSHTLNDKMSLCDKFIFLSKGRIVESGTLDDIQSNYLMILDVKNKSLDKETITRALPNASYTQGNNMYSIRVSSLDEARQIYNCIQDKFSEVFHLRKMSLDELFREINLGADDDED